MKKFNISLPKKYLKDGVEKTYWSNCGTLTQFDDGKMSIELSMFQDKFLVFPIEEKQSPSGSVETVVEQEEEIQVSNIPF